MYNVRNITVQTSEIVIVENIRLVRLPDLTADFGVKTNVKLMPIFRLRKLAFKVVCSQ